ncbi:GTP-dependent dephospho-CoA kinase family protein [Methanothermococcus sp. SCGC AD-155-C09]|nr:GTP-dependent dephospho-CoA kinase family protein [Methanothermococcus sp. SCGC AD-155-C09]
MYVLTEELREMLKKPFGKVYKELPPINGKVISIGDITTKNLISNNIIPKLSIFDLKTKRNIPVSIDHKFNKVFEVKNPPGCISDEAIEKIKYLSKVNEENMALKVEGEEDLLAIPVIKYFPNGTIVLYGQPNAGVVFLKINDDLKDKIDRILKSMIKK